MKKIRMLIITLILLIPIQVNAIVNDQTPTSLFATQQDCEAELALNVASVTQNATEGFYLTCIEVTCPVDVIVHNDLAPLTQYVSCANNNPTPQTGLIGGAAHGAANPLSVGSTCSAPFTTQWATAVYQFNCANMANGQPFPVEPETPTTTTPITQPTTTGPAHGGTTENPDTGLTTYYIVLIVSITILGTGLYYVNRHNLFKKI